MTGTNMKYFVKNFSNISQNYSLFSVLCSDDTIGYQILNLLSQPNATLAPQARQARASGENLNYVTPALQARPSDEILNYSQS